MASTLLSEPAPGCQAAHGGNERRVSAMTSTAARIALAVTILSSTACSLSTVLHKNLDAINASSAAITANNEVVKRSTSVSEEGIKSFQELKKPMESLSSLNPRLEAVAALDRPMVDVAALKPELQAVGHLKPELQGVGDLKKPMTDLVNLQPSLEATAALGPSMDRLAMMQASLERVA